MTDSMDEKVMEAVETLVKVKVAKALEEEDALIEKMVIKILEAPIYSSRGKKTFIQDELEHRVRAVVQKEVELCLAAQAEVIKQTIHAKAKPIMDKLVEQVINHFDEDDWRVKFDIHLGGR